MALKEKIIGLIIIIAGVLPLLLKVEKIANFFAKNKFLSYLVPGEIIYQIIIIILGVLLIWTVRPRIEKRR